MIVKHFAYSARMLKAQLGHQIGFVCFFKQTNNDFGSNTFLTCLHVVSRINSLFQKLYILKKQRKYIFKKALEANIWKIFENQKKLLALLNQCSSHRSNIQAFPRA